MQVVKSSVQANLNIANQTPRRVNAASANAPAGRTIALVNNLRLINLKSTVNMQSVQVRKAATVSPVAGNVSGAQSGQLKPSTRGGKFNYPEFKPSDVNAQYFPRNNQPEVIASGKKAKSSFRTHAYERSEI